MKDLIQKVNETKIETFQDKETEAEALIAWENALDQKAEESKAQEIYESVE
jgi:hypothetical protein